MTINVEQLVGSELVRETEVLRKTCPSSGVSIRRSSVQLPSGEHTDKPLPAIITAIFLDKLSGFGETGRLQVQTNC
jgi:hypothetical protein